MAPVAKGECKSKYIAKIKEGGKAMEKIRLTAILTGVMLAGSMTARAADADNYYQDLDALRELHVHFHRAVSHAGIDAATQAAHVKDLLGLWTDDGVLVAGGVTYTGKGIPYTASCAPGSLTLCDFYSHHAGGLALGHDWVSLTPIFTENIKVLDSENAYIYFQCIYLDVDNNDVIKSSVTFGLPGMPATGRAKKVNGQWLFSYSETGSIPPPTLDVYD
jgi:hypothetical protein